MRTLTSVDLDELRDLCSREEFFWLDLNDPDGEMLASAGEVLGLHPLAIEDTQEFDERPKSDVYGEQLMVVYFGARLDGDAPAPVEVHLHVQRSFVLTVHREPCERFAHVHETVRAHPPDSGQELVYRVFDALTDSILDVLEQVGGRVDEFESEVFRRPRARDRDRMAMLRRALSSFRRVLVVQRQVFDRTVERINELPGLDGNYSSYWRDVGDHLWRAVDETEASRDSLQGMLDTYSNEVQERLTIVATIFLPLTVITSFFGQNFTWMINHIGSAWTFWGLGVGGIVVSVLTIVAWLIRSGLYHGPGGD
jgi:magnesium transporter